MCCHQLHPEKHQSGPEHAPVHVLLWWHHICYSWQNEWRDISHLMETEPHKVLFLQQMWNLGVLTFYSPCRCPRWALNLLKWTWSSGICHFVYKYIFLSQAVNDDLVLKTMGISLNKSERWLSTDTVQINNVLYLLEKGPYSCWMSPSRCSDTPASPGVSKVCDSAAFMMLDTVMIA